MMAGTSPSITALPGGGFKVALQTGTGNLAIQGSDGWPVDRYQGMTPGTSPSIAGLPHGGYEAAFQASSNLWTLGWAGNNDWHLGMMPGTSPSIAGY
jgi:hypothetical protein